ncbi:MAG: twin-arginine translocase subunit TatC [Bacteroidales bacterium]|nr:twin-arginine translocase subunit TatC [Bacteroidales bacterium]
MKKKQDDGNVMTFWGHLEELRGHLIRSAASIGVFALLAFLNKEFLFSRIILAPKETYFFTNRMLCGLAERFSVPALCINAKPVEIINIDMAGQFTTHIVTSLVAGLLLSIPYVVWEIWRFIRPGLTPKEQANSRGAVLVISGLFITGVLFAYFLIVPLAVNFLGSYQVSSMVANQIALRSYISTVTTLTLATGLVFELPVFVYFLSRVGILTPAIMKKQRKLAFVLVIVLSAIITPPDVFSQILVSIPLFVLYELSIGISARVQKNTLANRMA